MQKLTDQAWQRVLDMSQRYCVSTDAVLSLMQSVMNGGGTMAQFYHTELGGGGQWMRGGMTMVGDMFNHSLKAKVDGLCCELSYLLQDNPFLPLPPVAPQPYFNAGQQQYQGSGNSSFGNFSGTWWPSDLGSPNSSGGQNNIRYAYFGNARRLAVELNGLVTIYDTLNHQINGVSQQQGGNTSLTFSSQFGTVSVSELPIVSSAGNAPFPNPAPLQNLSSSPKNTKTLATESEADVFTKIERLGGLLDKGMISRAEFDTKKAELLSRI